MGLDIRGFDKMTDHILEKAIQHWDYIAPIVHYPMNKKEYEMLVARLDELLDFVGNDEKHPLIGLIDVISSFISSYEAMHFQAPTGTGIDALKYLMETHDLH